MTGIHYITLPTLRTSIDGEMFNCKNPINQPEYSWPIWSDAYKKTIPSVLRYVMKNYEEDAKNDFLQVERVTPKNKSLFDLKGLEERRRE